jgi:hypothetical protein
MAHIDPRSYRPDPADRALVCPAARTWHALAITAVALLWVAPALVVGVLLLVEAAVPHAKPEMVGRSGGGPKPARLHASGPPLLQYSTACTQLEPAPCGAD